MSIFKASCAIGRYVATLLLNRDQMHRLGRQVYWQKSIGNRLLRYFKDAAFLAGWHGAFQSDCQLQKAALDGDVDALQQLRVQRFNEIYQVGAGLTYKKSDIEGDCILKSTSRAYRLPDGTPAVNLHGIGVALLSKIDHDAIVRADGRIFGTAPVLP